MASYTNDTGCICTRSEISGDILCRWPGEDCDCLMQRIDESYAPPKVDLDRLRTLPYATLTEVGVERDVLEPFRLDRFAEVLEVLEREAGVHDLAENITKACAIESCIRDLRREKVIA